MSEGPEGTPGTPEGGDGNYYDSFDADTKGWLDNRGMLKMTSEEALAASIKGHRNAEQSLGVPQDRRIDLPVDRTADGAMDSVYNKLGRPEKLEDYKFTNSQADGSDKAFDEFFSAASHKAGISQDNADAMYDGLKEFFGTVVNADDAADAVAREAEKLDLQKAWGATFDKNEIVAKAAVQKMGLDNTAFEAIQAALGYKSAFELFQRIGAGFGEDTFVGDTNGVGPGGPSTPDGARAEIATLKADKGFREKLLAGDVKANKLWSNLHQMAGG